MIEKLENRQLRSATVTETYPGFYEIAGTSGNDVISISVSMEDETFTLDNVTYPGVSGLLIQTGDGNDQVTVESLDGEGAIAATINGGSGNNKISLNFGGAIFTGDGDDELDLADSFRGEVHANGGNDKIKLSGFCQDAYVLAGDGDDEIDCEFNIGSVEVRGEAGNDLIIGSSYADRLYGGAGNDTIYGGSGNDVIYTGSGTDYADGESGNDVFYISDANWTVVGGNGSDSVLASTFNGCTMSGVEYQQLM